MHRKSRWTGMEGFGLLKPCERIRAVTGRIESRFTNGGYFET